MPRSVRVLLLLQLLNGALIVAERTFFPLFGSSIGMTPLAISAVSGSRQFLGMIAAIVGGYLADRIGRKWALFIGNLGLIPAALLFFSGAPNAVMTLWIVSGFFAGIATLGAQSYLVDAAGTSRLGTTSALFTWGTTAGGAAGSLGLGYLLNRSGYSPFAASLLAITAVLLLLNVAALPQLKSSRPIGGEARIGLIHLIKRREVVYLIILRFIPTFYWGMAIVLIPLLLVELGGSTLIVAIYGTVSQVVASLAQIVTGKSADHAGPRKPATVVLSALALAVCGTALSANNMLMVFVMSTLAASAAWSMSALVPVLVARKLPAELRAKTLGWVHFSWNLGMVAGSWTGGALYQINRGLPFAVAGIALIVTPFLVYRLTSPSKIK